MKFQNFHSRSSLTRNRSGSVLSRHSYGGSSLSLSSIGSGGGAPHATPLESGGVKKKKSLLSADYKEAVTSLTTNNNNNKSKIEGIAISTRVKNKKGNMFFYCIESSIDCCVTFNRYLRDFDKLICPLHTRHFCKQYSDKKLKRH